MKYTKKLEKIFLICLICLIYIFFICIEKKNEQISKIQKQKV